MDTQQTSDTSIASSVPRTSHIHWPLSPEWQNNQYSI